MGAMIAFCGLDCEACPALAATRANDVAKAEEIAQAWAKQFHVNVTVADVWCDGCTEEGRKCGYCGKCEIRACAKARGVENCAHCDDYGCDKLTTFFNMAPPAKANLEKIRAGLA